MTAYWRCLFLVLFLTSLTVAEEQLSAEQVIEYWISTQRQHPVDKVAFTWLEYDRTFERQINRLGEIVYSENSLSRMTFKPWPTERMLPTLRLGYTLKIASETWNYSWNSEVFRFLQPDGAIEHEISREYPIWFSRYDTTIEQVSPPLFPGMIQQARISKYDWKISVYKPDSIWLKGEPGCKPENDRDIPSWEVIIDQPSWKLRAARRIDRSGDREVVFVIQSG